MQGAEVCAKGNVTAAVRYCGGKQEVLLDAPSDRLILDRCATMVTKLCAGNRRLACVSPYLTAKPTQSRQSKSLSIKYSSFHGIVSHYLSVGDISDSGRPHSCGTQQTRYTANGTTNGHTGKLPEYIPGAREGHRTGARSSIITREALPR